MMCLLRLENLYLIYSTVNISCSYGSSGLQITAEGTNVNHKVDQAWLPSVREPAGPLYGSVYDIQISVIHFLPFIRGVLGVLADG